MQFVVAALLVGTSGSITGIPSGAHSEPAPSRKDPLEIPRLVDELQKVGRQEADGEASLWYNDLLYDFSPKPNSPQATSRVRPYPAPLRALIRKGVPALPTLLRRLTDDRYTGCLVDGQFFTDQYDPRYKNTERQSKGLNTGRRQPFKSYTLRVGDLCAIAVGEIVNRDLNPLNGRWANWRGLKSPVEHPALAEAIRQDWSGLTPAQHEASLVEDSLNSGGMFGPSHAVVTLWRYYPEAGERVALRLLARESDSVSLDEQVLLVKGLGPIQSERVDEAIDRMFLALSREQTCSEDRHRLDDQALTCAEILSEAGHKSILRGYFQQRVPEILRTPAASPERYRISLMKKYAAIPASLTPAKERHRKDRR